MNIGENLWHDIVEKLKEEFSETTVGLWFGSATIGSLDGDSVTIVADSGLYADALSTAVYVMGADAALALWRQQGDFQMVLVTDEGRILVTPGLTLLEAEAEVIS